MAKAKRMYGCTECGATFPKWAGQCGECGAWNTLVETVVEGATPSGRTGWAGDKANIKTLAEVSVEEIPRFSTASGELDRVLGGGVVPGSAILIGGNPGAGKSTLVNLLLRLYDLESGRILIDDQDIATVTQESLRANIGVVTQDTALLHRSIRDNLRYGKPGASDEELWEAVRKARADAFIPTLDDSQGGRGMDAQVGERGVKLSGGQRQRVMIAMALACRPALLIADEPTTALDVTTQAQILKLIRDLQQRKKTAVLFITHDLRVAAQICDDVAVMQRGRVVEQGPAAEVLTNPQQPYTRALLEAAPGRGWDFANFRPVSEGIVATA